MLTIILLFTTLFLSYSNGSNDNFKGVATLYGSNTLGYKAAITLATGATFLGSICAIFLAQGLIASFSGKGLVPQNVAGTENFLIATGLGAGGTVLLATRFGFPISTTQSLVGGLLGAGVVAVGMDVNFNNLGNTFFLPLLVSPFLAFALGGCIYVVFTTIRKKLGLTKESCICVGEPRQLIPLVSSEHAKAMTKSEFLQPVVTISNSRECVDLYTDKVWGISIQKLLDDAHILSALAVSFARGLNDTPKIAGLLVAVEIVDVHYGLAAIAVGIAIGGLLNSRRVAETMSKKIAEINHGQGFSANIVTSFLVIIASKFGVPVSTTHVSVGAIFGIGMVSKKIDVKIIRSIILSWLITLPVAMMISASVYWAIIQLVF